MSEETGVMTVDEISRLRKRFTDPDLTDMDREQCGGEGQCNGCIACCPGAFAAVYGQRAVRLLDSHETLRRLLFAMADRHASVEWVRDTDQETSHG